MNGKSTNKRANIFLLFIIVSSVMLPLALAETNTVYNLGTFKKGDVVILSQTCSNCSYINISRVIYPNSQPSFINERMSQPVLGNFNYSFTNTTALKDYIVTTCGDEGGNYVCADYRFKITTTGDDIGTTAPIFLLIGGFLLLVWASYSKIPAMGVFAGVLLSVAGVYLRIYGFGLIENLYTQSIGYSSLFIGIIAMSLGIYEAFK